MDTERVAIFIDGSNLFHALQTDFKRIDIDFELLTKALLRGRSLVRVYYYTALPDQSRNQEKYQKQQKFVAALSKKDYFSVVLGRLEPREHGFVEKGVDISLAVDVLEMGFRDGYDTAIIISGDGDFAKAVEVVKHLGKHVENASTKSCLSRHLQAECDKTITLSSDFMKSCWRH
jgi:uncharacterized LabA/DUF88 family protein